MTTLRNLPSVEELLQTKSAAELIAAYGRPLTLKALRAALEDIRADHKSESSTGRPNEGILSAAETQCDRRSPLLPVINAPVILHTNLGCARWERRSYPGLDMVSLLPR
jgi:hypothetical protein